MPKAKTPSFILELGLETSHHDETELNARFEAARQLYNACLGEALRRLELLRQSKEYQHTRSMPKTINGKSNRERTEAFKRLNAHFGFSEYDLHAYSTKIRNCWIGNHLDSTTAQKIASRAFKAVQRIAFGQAKRVRFKGKNQLKSVEGKTNTSGIRYRERAKGFTGLPVKPFRTTGLYKEQTGHVEWNGLKLKCIIDVNDKVVVHGLSCHVKYLRIIKRTFNGKTRFFVQLILSGKPYQKFSAPDNIVGLDIGPSTIACVSKDKASLERFCDELSNKQKEIRQLQRKLDRQRHANNPQNYNPDGTIKPCKKTWHESTRYKKTKRKLAELQRKLAAHRKTLHGNLANRILRQGKHIKTEKLSYRAFQKNYGRSVKDRAPGKFMEILRRKAENAGGLVDEFSTKETKLSQYCHKCGKYTKKPLSQRVHTCCNLNIQRDLYSAFLASSVVENKLDTADVRKRWRSTEAVLRRAVSKQKSANQVASGRLLLSSFGLSTRDRATRLRSSDALKREIPDVKDQDVVAVQL
jgi:putative transposase